MLNTAIFLFAVAVFIPLGLYSWYKIVTELLSKNRSHKIPNPFN